MNSRNTFVSKLAGLMSAVALAVVLSGGMAYAQDAAVTRHDPAFLTVLSRHTRHKGALIC